jgi:hypothetical protein
MIRSHQGLVLEIRVSTRRSSFRATRDIFILINQQLGPWDDQAAVIRRHVNDLPVNRVHLAYEYTSLLRYADLVISFFEENEKETERAVAGGVR